jgi:hypothetical protein
MEKSAFTRMNLSDVRVVMAIMHVLMGELLCQAVARWISVLEGPLSGARGLLWLRLVMPDIKCHCFSRTQLQWCIPSTGEPSGVATEGPGVCRAGA